MGSAGDFHEDSKTVTQCCDPDPPNEPHSSPALCAQTTVGIATNGLETWQGLLKLSWAGCLPACHPMVDTVVVTSLMCLTVGTVSAMDLKAFSLCKANKPLQSLEPVLETQIRKWLLPCCCHLCRLLTCSRRVVLPPLCPLFLGYLLQFSPALGSEAALVLHKSGAAHACCPAALETHMAGEGKGLGYFGHWLLSWESGEGWIWWDTYSLPDGGKRV